VDVFVTDAFVSVVLSGHTVLSEIWALALVDDGVLIHFKFSHS
jgi:hypothetical protein